LIDIKKDRKEENVLEKSTKASLIEEVQDKFKRANATFIAEYQGIKAQDMNEFRASLRKSSMDFKVVRNTLARRAVQGTPVESLAAELKGPTAIAFSYNDAAQAAKTLVQFAKDQPKLKLKVGTLGNKVITVQEIKGLAELPSKDVLLAKMLGSMKAPMTGIVGVLAGVPRKFLFALNAIKDQKAASAGA
jgi:large subunit ribosomal protein L10